MQLFYLRNYLVGVSGCLSEILFPVCVRGREEQVRAAWLLKIGESSACFHVMGPEILPPTPRPSPPSFRLRIQADSQKSGRDGLCLGKELLPQRPCPRGQVHAFGSRESEFWA